jgi:hypothetical protein
MVITFECLEGRVFGARYYTVQPKFDHWSIFVTENWDDMVAWCVQTFGPTPSDGIWTPGSRWYVNNAKFWFRKEEDKMLFLLRWT